MTTCSACGSENPPSSRFCGRCGAALATVVCTGCGAPNPADHRFCGQCGTPLEGGVAAPSAAGTTSTAAAAAAPPPVDERKLATVLFADVVGFTTMAERTDPETVARMVDAAFRRLAEVVHGHGGTVDKYMGDSLMAVFGVPQAHDDDAERAVAAGLAMRGLGGDLAFSIGINTGEVLATNVGSGVTVIGDAVNVAARLEKLAGPGQVLVGKLTAELAGERVVFRERQPIVVKGRQEPVEVCEAVALRRDGARDTGEAPPLVGRDDELTFLRGLWQRVRRDGQAAVVLVTGEAGVGKTRLVEALATDAEDGGATVARASYPAYGAMGGPRVAAQLVEQLGEVGDAEVDVRLRSIRGEVDPSLRSFDPNAFRQEQFWAFRRLLATRSDEQPVMVVVDHMHRAGDVTLGLLAELTARLGDLAVLMVLVGRPEPADWLSRFPSATTVRLGPLGPDDAATLATALVPDRPLGAEAARAVAERAGGNPLFVRELLAMLRARGQLETAGQHYELVQGLALPPSLHAILAARLDALSADEKLAIQHLGVLGQPATTAQVEALGLANAGAALRALVRARLVRQDADGTYDIADALLREVAYETLPRHVRGERHRRAAALVDDPEDRARHLDRAAGYLPDDEALAREAGQALARAGSEVLALLRPTDGVRLLQRAIELGWRESASVIQLAEALGTLGRTEEAGGLLAYLPDDERDPVVAAERVHIAARAVMFRNPTEAVPLFDEAIRRWREQGNTVKEAWAHANKGAALFNESRMEEASAALEDALQLFRKAGLRSGELSVYTFLALVRPTDPRVPDWLAESLVDAEEAGDRPRQLSVLLSLAWHHFLRERWGGDAETEQACEYAARLADLAEAVDAYEFRIHGIGMQANLARLAGRLDEARAHVERAYAGPMPERSSVVDFLGAVHFSLDLACGADPTTYVAPPRSRDPVIGMALVVAAEALILAGHGPELADFLGADILERSLDLGVIEGLLVGLLGGLRYLQDDQLEEAAEAVRDAETSGRAMSSASGCAAARALRVELSARLGHPPSPDELGDAPSGGVARALWVRARAVLGDDDARRELSRLVEDLRAPGLALSP